MRYYDKLQLSPRIVEIFGKFPPSTVAETATKTWAYAAAKVATFEYTTAATAALQNAFDIAVTDTGATACHLIHATTENDCTFSTLSETGWTAQIEAHTHTGAGVLVREDATGKTLICTFEEGVSTMADLKTAVNANCTKVRAHGGTATGALTAAADVLAATAMNVDTVKAWFVSQTAVAMEVAAIITGSSATIADVVALVNESTLANAKLTLAITTGAGTDDITTALASTTLDTNAAVDAVALDTSLITGEGFTVARTGAAGTGEYTVTLDRGWSDAKLIEAYGVVQLPTTEATLPQATVRIDDYSESAKTLVLTTYDHVAGAAIDLIYAANRFIHFGLKFVVNR